MQAIFLKKDAFTSFEPEIVLPVLQIKSRQNQVQVRDLYNTRKSTKNWSPNVALLLSKKRTHLLLVVK